MRASVLAALKAALANQPIRVVDVGARGGWQPAWRPYRALAQLIGFEPDREECRRLRAAAAPNEMFLDQALYRETATVELHHHRVPSWTSLYPLDEEVVRELFPGLTDGGAVRTERIAATTMDRPTNHAAPATTSRTASPHSARRHASAVAAASRSST
jgi:hypothetical protein